MNRNIYNPVNQPDKRRISVIIPAAGYGKRMKSFGAKSLLLIRDNVSIIDNQLKNIFKYLYKPQIIIVGGNDFVSLQQEVNRRNVLVIENKEWETSNVTQSIHLGLQAAKHDNVLLVYGDLVFNGWTLKSPFGGYSMVLGDSGGFMKDEEVGYISYKNVLTNMMYSLPNKWAQIAYFTNKELALLKEFCGQEEYKNYYGFEIINKIVDSGGTFTVYSPKRMKITDVDYSKDLDKVEDILCK